MKKGFFLRLFVLLMLTFFIAEQGRAQTYQRTSQGIKSTVQGINIDISFFSPVTVRILKSPDGWKYTKESLSVIGQPALPLGGAPRDRLSVVDHPAVVLL